MRRELNKTMKNLCKAAQVALLAVAVPVIAQPDPPRPPVPGQPGGPAAKKPGQPDRQRKPDNLRDLRDLRGPGGPGAGPMMARHRRGPGGPGGFGRRQDPSSGRLLQAPEVREKLNLTDDQVKRIEDIVFNSEKQAIQIEARIKTAELEMHRALKEKRPDKDRVLAQVEEVAKARTELARVKMQAHLDTREVLNDQQLEQFQKFIREKGLHGKFRGGRGVAGPGPGPRPGVGFGPFAPRFRERIGEGMPGPEKVRQEREQQLGEIRKRMEERRRKEMLNRNPQGGAEAEIRKRMEER